MPKKRARSSVIDVIAERVFKRSDGKEVRAIVGRPRPVGENWECDFQILNIGRRTFPNAGGADSLQALQMALGMMAVYLEEYQREHGLTLDGDPELLLMAPDVAAVANRLRERPDYSEWAP
jgi:hypothetical protein